jgi:hypothetical protein
MLFFVLTLPSNIYTLPQITLHFVYWTLKNADGCRFFEDSSEKTIRISVSLAPGAHLPRVQVPGSAGVSVHLRPDSESVR